jgi:formylglycine-generating enzyme required for sulfatase activity
MHGNVWEYCSDWFDADHYSRGESIDPTGPESGDSHVLRGGSWYSQPTVCRTACRNPVANYNTGGFRVVAVVGA